MDGTTQVSTYADYRYTGIIEHHIPSGRMTARIQREHLQITDDGLPPLVIDWEPDFVTRVVERPTGVIDTASTILDGWGWDLDAVVIETDPEYVRFYIQDPWPLATP